MGPPLLLLLLALAPGAAPQLFSNGISFPSQPIADGAGYHQPFMIHPRIPPSQLMSLGAILDAYPTGSLGGACSGNDTCNALVPNSACINATCACLPNFMPDPLFPNACRLAPGFGEVCASDSVCRAPFVCNSTTQCDCPPGTIQEFFQCVPDCGPGKVPVEQVCYPAAELGSECEVGEQCVQSYADCRHGRCQCIPGANQIQGACFPVNKCPLGEVAKDGAGGVLDCKAGEGRCPDDHYCLYAEFSDAAGFCCPKIKMNCPIGHPLEGANCSNCPWETHHCFSYVIGSYTETMCCPNACPSSQPIQTNGKCYARAAFGGHCAVDEQCYNVVGAQCRQGGEGEPRCLCPPGNYRNHFGRCIRESRRGEECGSDAECEAGSNTVCVEGRCACYPGYMPKPTDEGGCIAEPTCPVSGGVKVMREYRECGETTLCGAGEFCRTWWFDLDNTTFALCCPKPSRADYEGICSPLGLELLVGVGTQEPGNGLRDEATDFPVPCDLAPSPATYRFRDAVDPTLGTVPSRLCPPGSTCIFDPFSVNKGVCCTNPPSKPIDEEVEVSQVAAKVKELEQHPKNSLGNRRSSRPHSETLPSKKPLETH